MTRAAIWLLAAGVLLFAGVLISQGLTAVFSTLAVAGWGLPLVALIHLLPLALDAASARVMFDKTKVRSTLRDAILARWVGESANSFLPAGPIGGPVVMSRYFAQRGMSMKDAAAGVTVSTTLQALAQLVFALMGVAMLGAHATNQAPEHAIRAPLLVAGTLVMFCLTGFYLAQRNGLFGKLVRMLRRFAGKRDLAKLISQADAIDHAVQDAYGRRGRAAASFFLSLAGWVIGTVEVYVILQLLQFPVSWGDALMLESLGQAIRAAGFAIPGSLGIQEGGFLLLAPLVDMRPETALALSLAKRAREVILGAPGLLYLHLSERGWRRRLAV
jgi:putative membrane protein